MKVVIWLVGLCCAAGAADAVLVTPLPTDRGIFIQTENGVTYYDPIDPRASVGARFGARSLQAKWAAVSDPERQAQLANLFFQQRNWGALLNCVDEKGNFSQAFVRSMSRTYRAMTGYTHPLETSGDTSVGAWFTMTPEFRAAPPAGVRPDAATAASPGSLSPTR
jgi:hypothetical protein